MYTKTGILSCRKAVSWLEDHDIPFVECSILLDPPSKEFLYEMLEFTEHGIDDLVVRTVDRDLFESMPLSQALNYLQDHPNLIRTPLIYDGKRLQIGFHEDGIRCFIPRKCRRKFLISYLGR